jgi:hypothetical protein
MGGGGKSGTTTTQTMQIPPEVMARYNDVNARAAKVAETPYQKYSNDPNAFVAPLTATQQAGIQNTNTMAGAAQPYYGAAAALTAAGAGSANPQGLNVGQYYNPYTQAVAAPTLEALQQQQATERSSLMNPQSARSFGGDRSGLVAANLARQQALGTAQAMNPIYQQGYDKALATAAQQQGVGLAAQQANLQRLGQAGAQFGQLGSGAQAAGLAGATAQLGAGATEQQTGQAGLQALYNQFQQQQAYPFQIAQFLSNIATGTGALSGNTTSGSTQGGGGFFSDERLKENVEQVGKTNDGQNIYRYNYKGDPRSQIGLIAQEVAQEHPEAVGQRDGYLTVDYRDATNDAVREHKADGGDIGTSAYDISAPSAMMGGSPVSPEVLAGLVAKPMVGLGGMPIATGATSPGAAGILAPKATGVSPGSIEGAQAQLATLRGADMGKSQSGSDYFDQQKQQLQDFLSAHGASSQGGLVSGPGEYARGGYAEGGYMNPALQFYGAQGGKSGLGAGGPYGAQLTPAQVQMMRAAELPRQQQQRSGIEQANQIANMAVRGNDAWKARPDFLRSEADVAERRGDKARSWLASTEPGAMQGPGTEDVMGRPLQARGGMIHREHHAGLGPVGGGMPYGSVEEENPLGEVLTAGQQRPQMMQPGKMGQPTPPPTGAQQLNQAAGLAKSGKNVYDFAAKKLAGDTTGLAGQTVNVGSATSAVAPGVEAGIAAAAPAVEGLAAAAPIAEGLAAAAPIAEGAGLIGSLATGAAAAGEGIMAALPFLALLSDRRSKHDIESVGELNDGQPVYRFKYNGDDETRMGLMAQDVEKDHPEAVKGLGGMKMVDYHRATDDAARQRHSNGERVLNVDQNGDPIPVVEDAAPRGDRMNFAPDEARLSGLAARPVPPRDIPNNVTERAPVTREEPSRLASFASDVGDFASGLGKKAADADSNFWVPAIAGLGSMLASPNKTLAGAIGSGLVGGTGAYTALQKQNADLMKQRFDIAKTVFRGPIMNSNEEWTWEDTRTGEMLLQPEYQRRYRALVGGSSMPVSPPAPTGGSDRAPPPVAKGPLSIVDTAKDTTSAPPPRLEPRAAPKPEPKPVPEPGATPDMAKPVVQEGGEKSMQRLRIEAFEDASNWEGSDPSTDPRILLPEVKVLNGQIKQLEEQAVKQNALATKAAERDPKQAEFYQNKATNLLAQSERLRKERDDKATAAQKAIDGAVQFAVEERKARIAKGVERDFLPEIAPSGEKASLPPGQKMPVATAPTPTEEQAAAPKIAEVDNKTGQLTLARPAAPAGGGLIQPNLPPGSKVIEQSPTAKNQNAMDEQFLKDFMEKAPSVSQAKQRYMGLINAFKMFESGSTEGTRAAWAAVAQTFGFPDIAQKIASGDPAGVQWVEKIGPNLVLDTLKAATPRFAQSEFVTIQRDGTPSPNKLPDANFEMVKEGLATLNRTDAFMQAWQRASQEEGWRSPSAYYLAWSKANPIDKFMKATERQMGNFAGMPLPPSSEWTPGAIYVVPNNLSGSQSAFFRSRGMKAGDAFQYGGSDAPPDLIIRPIPKRQLYSTPAMGQ